jgi:hypothetical protein
MIRIDEDEKGIKKLKKAEGTANGFTAERLIRNANYEILKRLTIMQAYIILANLQF